MGMKAVPGMETLLGGTFAPPPHDLPEKDFTKLVIDYARSRGWRTAHFRPAMTSDGHWVTAVQGDGAGFVDIVLVRPGAPGLPGTVLWVELKSDGGRLSADQRAWRDVLLAAGERWYCFRPAQWAELVGVLG